jgi:signal peptidase II
VIVIIATVLIDQWSKWAVFALLEKESGATLPLTGFLNFVMVWNRGISFGLFGKLEYSHIIFAVIALILTIILLVWMVKAKNTLLTVALGLITGGAIGNIIDRVRFGAVADFIDFYIKEYHWPAFNIADSAVCVGVFMVCLDGVLSGRIKEKTQE